MMDLGLDDPIAALASAAGGASRGIVRISGATVREVLGDCFIPRDPLTWQAIRSASAHVGELRLQIEGRAVHVPVQVLCWPNRRSYTGQTLIELHLPGSPCLLEAVLGEIFRRGARAARPGEFTLRAFLAGKLDLLQAEAVLGVIDAHDHQELQTALSQLAGGVSGHLGRLRHELLELLADLEAGLDFIEEDIEFVSRDEVIDRLSRARTQVTQLLRQASDRMQSRTRSRVVLAGLPNAGKSTLFNKLAGTEAALVSPEHGTTRDFLARKMNWDDLSFELIDTAGWEQRSDGIGIASQAQRDTQFQQSDLLVWCSAADMDQSEQQIDESLFQTVQRQYPTVIRLRTKMDSDRSDQPHLRGDIVESDLLHSGSSMIPVSAMTERGLAAFSQLVRRRLSAEHSSGQWLGMTAARCRDTLEAAAAALERAYDAAIERQVGDELVAVDLRHALDQLGVILGVIYTDDVLDRVFSKFCIGK